MNDLTTSAGYKTKSMKTEIDQMPRETAIALLTSNQKMTGSFRRTCLRATERRISRLDLSAPATPMQRFERKLRKANAKQLTTWLRRATRRGNRLQDARDKVAFTSHNPEGDSETIAVLELLTKQIGQIDAIAESIKNELDNRQSRGIFNHV